MSNSWQEMPGTPGIFRAPYTVPGTTPFSTIVDLGDNNYLIYSPGPDLESNLPDSISASAKLLLLAPCTGHNLGLEPWLQSHLDATAFAPKGVKARLEKKKRDTSALHSIEELVPLLPDHVQLHELPDNNFHEVWISVEKNNTVFWMFGDAILNFDSLDVNFIIKFLLGVYGIKEGLNLHKMFLRGLKDKSGFKEWGLKLFDDNRRHILLPCHRETYDAPDCGQRIVSLLNALG